jgi:hypothetical protein
MGPPPPHPVRVGLELPAGWVELPAPGRRRGVFRRDPFAALAQQLIDSGAVVPALARSTRNYLERVAPTGERHVAGAALVRATNADDAVLASYGVFCARSDSGVAPVGEGLTAWLSKRTADLGELSPVELRLGPAVRREFTGAPSSYGPSLVVQHWVHLPEQELMVLLTGESADHSLVSDFDAIAAGVALETSATE